MIGYDNRDLRFIFLRRAGSVLFSRFVLMPAALSTVLCSFVLLQPDARRFAGVSKDLANIYATIIGFVIVFRTSMAFGRFFEGVTHIQAMFSRWRDAFVAVAVFVETSMLRAPEKAPPLKLSKARLLHWFSLLCAVAVQTIQHGRDDEWSLSDDLGVAQVRPANAASSARSFGQQVQIIGRVTNQEMQQISEAQEAVNMVMKWILLEISELSMTQTLLIEPPILTRIYQELSNGMLSYFRAMQIEAVPFPFPFAQVINYTLYGFFWLCPFIVMEILSLPVQADDVQPRAIWPSLLLNFCACVGYAALNEISIELEDPFGEDDNDYPIAVQQWAIVWAMEDCYFAKVPVPLTPKVVQQDASRQVASSDSVQRLVPAEPAPHYPPSTERRAKETSNLDSELAALRIAAIELISEFQPREALGGDEDFGAVRQRLARVVTKLEWHSGRCRGKRP